MIIYLTSKSIFIFIFLKLGHEVAIDEYLSLGIDSSAIEATALESEMTTAPAQDSGEHVCNSVKKIDRFQHLRKCFRDKLEELSQKPGAVVSDGKSINRGSNRLRLEYIFIETVSRTSRVLSMNEFV